MSVFGRTDLVANRGKADATYAARKRLMTQPRHQPPYFAAMHNRVCRNDVLG